MTKLSKEEVNKILKFARNICQSVGDFLVESRRQVSIEKYKDAVDVVTNLDLAAEKQFISAIRQAYSDHSIFSEEAGNDQKKSDFHWIIDPIDGTKEFLRSLPNWNTNLALEHQGTPIISAIYKPIDQELFSASIGYGAYLNQSEISPSNQTDLSKAMIYSYLPTFQVSSSKANKAWDQLHQLSRKAYRVRSTAEEVVGISWVASGKIDAYLNNSTFPKWYDFVSGLIIAKAAGVIITDLTGKPITKYDPNLTGYVATNHHLHPQILKLLN